MVKGRIKEDWRELEPTEKQIEAIYHMSNELGREPNIPKTRGECCDLIGKLIDTITNNLVVTGYINPEKSAWFREDGDDWEDICYGGG